MKIDSCVAESIRIVNQNHKTMNRNKKSLIYFMSFLTAISLLLFVNCNSDDVEDEGAMLIGVWSVTTLNIEMTIDGKSFTQYLLDYGISNDEVELAEDFFISTYEDRIKDLVIEFKDDNTYDNGFEIGTWSYDALNKILTTMPDDFNTFEQKVKSITSTTLVIIDELMGDRSYYEFNGEDIGEIDTVIEVTFTKS